MNTKAYEGRCRQMGGNEAYERICRHMKVIEGRCRQMRGNEAERIWRHTRRHLEANEGK